MKLQEINNRDLLKELANRVNANELSKKQVEKILEKSTQTDKLAQEYQEAYQDPKRLKLTKEWERASLSDLKKRTKNAN